MKIGKIMTISTENGRFFEIHQVLSKNFPDFKTDPAKLPNFAIFGVKIALFWENFVILENFTSNLPLFFPSFCPKFG
jgi:hypothetical protein